VKILSAHQIRETDAYTIQHEPIASIDLMERAAQAFTEWFTNKFENTKNIYIVCGTGNNGGDGMAVGRMLYEKEYQIAACVVGTGSGSEDFQINKGKLSRDIEIPVIEKESDIPDFNGYEIIIDAIFGSGLARSPSGIYALVINTINHSPGIRVSIDIASGLFCDSSSNTNISIQAAYTVSFQLPKMAFLMAENDESVGSWEVVDIGLDKGFLKREVTPFHYLTKSFFDPFLFPRKKHAHKGDFGKGLLITGSYGKMGASVLCARAYMRSGAGLLTVLAPKCGYHIIQTTVPEAMVVTNGNDIINDDLPPLDDYDIIGIGPGIGVGKSTINAVKRILELTDNPVVIDADGLNIISKNRQLLKLIPPQSILTPHPKEFERLTGEANDNFDTIKKLIEFAKRLKCYVILKGAHTAISTPDGKVYFNSTGNPGMATGGSGDVLTGVITSLIAQHQSSFHAAILGVFVHGLSGDITADFLGQDGMIASDIVDHLPDALNSIHGN